MRSGKIFEKNVVKNILITMNNVNSRHISGKAGGLLNIVKEKYDRE